MTDLSKASLQKLRKRLLTDLRFHENAAADLRSALSDLEAAERLLGRLDHSASHQEVELIEDFNSLPYSDQNPFRQGSIRAVIWEVLQEGPELWLTTEAVRQEVSKILKRSFSRNSVGATLSRMKPHVRREGLRVASSKRVRSLTTAALDAVQL